jgi:methylenetetrahydrofolate dehydrogenase (NADP+)/methenyltetrahydrofolate cyclohydrolase
MLDKDPTIHGIIVQRPIPASFNRTKVVNAISPRKDVDGFRPDSKFEVPVWLAVKRLIAQALLDLDIHKGWRDFRFVVLGKGETAGGPVIAGLKSLGLNPLIVDSKTINASKIIKTGDIIISCVGKSGILNSASIKKGAILIGVGTHGEDGKLRGDYDVSTIKKIAGAYTPTPGGVGPVNLSYLFKNLVDDLIK